MRKMIVGFIAGVIMATTVSVYADEGLQKIEAYVRAGLPIMLDGQQVTPESPPVMVDGSTYLKLRDVAKITGVGVNWNESTQTVELTSKDATTVKSMSLAGSEVKVTTSQEEEVKLLINQITELKANIQGFQLSITGAEYNLQNPDNPNKDLLKQKIIDLQSRIADAESQITTLEAQKAQLTGTP